MKDKSKYRLIYYMLDNATINKPVSRETLVAETVLTDRKVRDMIDDMRDAGVRVCGLPSNRGYWIAKNGIEFNIFRAHYMKYADTMRARCAAMYRNAITSEWQFEEWLDGTVSKQIEMRM